jgi:hypothetical protein
MNTQQLMQTLARDLDKTLKKIVPGTMFSLIIWQPGNESDAGRFNYVSNATRESVAEGMREVLSRWDQPGYKKH